MEQRALTQLWQDRYHKHSINTPNPQFREVVNSNFTICEHTTSPKIGLIVNISAGDRYGLLLCISCVQLTQGKTSHDRVFNNICEKFRLVDRKCTQIYGFTVEGDRLITRSCANVEEMDGIRVMTDSDAKALQRFLNRKHKMNITAIEGSKA